MIKESDDVLHLCVSSKYTEVYALACKLVENLLTSLYKEYEVFCQKLGRPLKEPVQLKRVEICGNEKKLEENNESNSKLNNTSQEGGLNRKESFNNSHDEISNNSLSTQPDREANISPIKQNEVIVQFDELDLKCPEITNSQHETCQSN